MRYFVYILKNSKDDELFIGQTNNTFDCLKKHNKGLYYATQKLRPLEIIHIDKYNTRTLATQREEYLKSPEGLKYILENIINKSPIE